MHHLSRHSADASEIQIMWLKQGDIGTAFAIITADYNTDIHVHGYSVTSLEEVSD